MLNRRARLEHRRTGLTFCHIEQFENFGFNVLEPGCSGQEILSPVVWNERLQVLLAIDLLDKRILDLLAKVLQEFGTAVIAEVATRVKFGDERRP